MKHSYKYKIMEKKRLKNLVKNVGRGCIKSKNAFSEEISTLLHCSSRHHLTGHAGGKIEKKHRPPSLATTE